MDCSSCVGNAGLAVNRFGRARAIAWLNRHMSDRALQGIMVETHYRQCHGPLFRFVDWALGTQMDYFRYGVISSLLPGDDGRKLKDRIQELAGRPWALPDGRIEQFSWTTIEGWLYDFRAGGLPALKNAPRKDRGTYPGIPEGVCAAIDELLRDHPKLKTSNIIRVLRERDQLPAGRPGKSTIYRYLRTKRPDSCAPDKERRAFEAPYAGSLWQVDFMYGPFLPEKGRDGRWRKQQTYLIGVLDDHSRLLCHGQFYFQQSLLVYIDAFKTACRKRGVEGKSLLRQRGRLPRLPGQAHHRRTGQHRARHRPRRPAATREDRTVLKRPSGKAFSTTSWR